MFTVHPPLERLLSFTMQRHLFCVQERLSPVISQEIQHKPQRVQIHIGGIALHMIYFRGHIVVGAFHGKALAGGSLLKFPGNAEVPELKHAELIDENIFRFYVTVDHIPFFTRFQGTA